MYRSAAVEQALQVMEKLHGQSLNDVCLDALIKCLPEFNLN